MKNVLQKNSLFHFIVVIILFSFKPDNKIRVINNHVNADSKQTKVQLIKKPLTLNVKYKNFGVIEISEDSIDWDKIEPDSLMVVNLSFKKELKKDYKFKIGLIATRIPFVFRIKKEKNNNITFLIIHQFNTIWIHSLVFIKNKNNYELKKSFLTEYSHQDIDYICPQKIIKKNNFFEFKESAKCFKRKRR
jgi:hypothetical protein